MARVTDDMSIFIATLESCGGRSNILRNLMEHPYFSLMPTGNGWIAFTMMLKWMNQNGSSKAWISLKALSVKRGSSAEDAGASEKADESNGAQDESAGPEVETAGNAEAGAVQVEAEAEGSPVTEVQAEAEETAAEEPAREVFTGYSDSDYDVLLRIVQAEAGNCDMEGRVMVANVILNRVENDSFPNTITKVVYQKHQFSPVSNGSIKRCRVTAETVEAVGRALSGEDLTDGALYFMNRHASSKKNASWFDRHLEFLFKHGNHEFFR